MQVAICDDENIFLEQLEVLLKSIPEIKKTDSYNSVDKLCQQLEYGYQYDIIFMDIEWNDSKENGTHYASRINSLYPNIQIIFVTAYNDRFAEAIFWEPVNLCGYLLKPVQKSNLLLLLEKAKKGVERQQREKLVVQYRGVAETIAFSNIIYLESNAHQLFIVTITDRIMIYEKLDDYEKKLNASFVRIHKSYLVNMNYIKKFEKNELTLKNGITLPISKKRNADAKDKFFKFMGEQL